MPRLDQMLSAYGYCTRSEAGEWLRKGRVHVRGQAVLRGNVKAEPEELHIDGEPIEFPRGMLLLMHKPLGLVCSHDPREGPNVYSLLPPRLSRRNPQPASIGRLDKDSSGVLLITDDGQLNHRWTSPRHKVEKVYEVTLDHPLADQPEREVPGFTGLSVEELFARGGIRLDGEDAPCGPARYERTGDASARLTLTEGKYHQVRRMFAALGWHVTRLHRSRFGDFTLDGLEAGQWRPVELAL
jgi:16S rRNA pseudouridine516 synthase